MEIACGTGLVTQRLRERLDPSLRLVATDISKAMLDYGRSKLRDREGIEWRDADARRPDRISEQEVQNYLLHLIEKRKLAWSSCNVVAQGLKFFYRVTLKRSEGLRYRGASG